MTKTESSPHRATLIIGLSIPVLMMALVAAAIYLPRLFATVEPPAFDFVYSMGQHDPYAHYLVRDHRLSREQRAVAEDDNRIPAERYFFVHAVAGNRSREITFAEAQRLYLEATAVAPDGYRLERGHRAGWFPFDSYYDYRTRFLIKDHFSQELNLQLDGTDDYHFRSYRFHGWIGAEPS